MKSARGLVVAPFFVVAGLACNAITGEHERFLDDGVAEDDGGKSRPDTSAPRDSGPRPIEAGADVDAEPQLTELVLGKDWDSPNNGSFVNVGTATKFAGYVTPANHPMFLPKPPPALPSANYKVTARIRSDAQSEFGVIVRGRGTGATFSALILSSRFSRPFGPTNAPFLSPITVAADNPESGDPGPEYAYENGKIWVFEVEAKDAEVTGRIFREDNPAITSKMTFNDPAPAADRGRQIGFFGFQKPDATVLEMKVIY